MDKKQWPGISIPEEDSELVTSIIRQDGLLRSMNQKELLLLAAALAVKKEAPEVIESSGKRKDVTHQSLINGDNYNKYRQYISMIYYQTAGKKDLKSMADPKLMVDNFVDYARRGLRLLKVEYLESNNSDEELLNNFVDLLESAS
jgi:magnesium-transporting ATPase (P-type)